VASSFGTNPGSIVGNVTYEPGMVDQGFSLPGSAALPSRVEIPDSLDLQLTGPFTLEAWVSFNGVSPATHGVSNSPIIGKWGSTTNGTCGYGLFVYADGRTALVVSTTGYNAISVISPPLTSGTFTHVAGIWTGTQLEIFLDGVSCAACAFNGPLSVNPGIPLLIGGYSPAHTAHSDSMIGIIDEASIYTRALTPQEIEDIFTAGSAGKNKMVDSDGDGLLDGVETNTGVFVDETDTGIDPNNPDTDGDGLWDGTEVEMADGYGCPNPLDPDSDGDTLPDGYEIIDWGSCPCKVDTDEDGLADPDDCWPAVPGTSSGCLENLCRGLALEILALDLTLINGPNKNANKGRRNSLANRSTKAANSIAKGDIHDAVEALTSLLQKIDGDSPPPDWMDESPEKIALADKATLIIDLLNI